MDIKIKCDYRKAKRCTIDTSFFQYKYIIDKMQEEMMETIEKITMRVWYTMKSIIRGPSIKESCNLTRQKDKHMKKL